MFRGIDTNDDGGVSFAEIKRHLADEELAMRHVDEELVEFDVPFEAEDWMACQDLDEDGVVLREEYLKTVVWLGNLFVQAQSEGACDEGCDTPLELARRQKAPVDLYPGAAFDGKRKLWRHSEL